jgi:predicted dehydrogenase
MALTLADAKEMWQTAKDCGKQLFPCQCMRWRNYMQRSKELVDAGELGEVYFSDIEFIRRIGIPTWGMFHMKEHNFGGPFCDLGVHLIDSLIWILGGKKVEAVSGSTYTKITNKGEDVLLSIAESGAYSGVFTPRKYDHKEFNVEEFSTGFMRLEGGASVNFKFSWAVNLPTTNLDMVICGDKGGLSVNKETLYKNVGRFQSESQMKWFDNGEYKGVPFEQHRYMYRNIMNTLAGKETYLITEAENLEVTKAIECFYRSAELGREVRAEELN